jgi:hypothetical protein
VKGAASRLPELLASDPVKPILPGLEQHALQAHACGLLSLGALTNQGPGRMQALGQVVAYQLELAEVKQPRSERAHRRLGVEATQRDGGQKRVGKLAFELDDLQAQRSPRRTLDIFIDKRRENRGKRPGAVVCK